MGAGQLKDTMTFIANILNSRGIISWTTAIDAMSGAKYTSSNSLEQVSADPSTCSLAWTNVTTVSTDKTVDTYLLQLRDVSSVDVQLYSRCAATQTSWNPRFLPDTYLAQIKTTTAIRGQRESYKKNKLKAKASLPHDHLANIRFADEQTATRVADAIRQAAGLCGAIFQP